MRGLVFGLALALCALAPSVATAATKVEAEFELPTSNGFEAAIDARGEQVVLAISSTDHSEHWGRDVAYGVRGEVREDGIEARFGQLGNVALEFQPTAVEETAAGPGCPGEKLVEKEGVFSGEVHFRGEGGFTTIDVGRVEGTVRVKQDHSCAGRRDARAAASRDRGEVGALRAIDRDRRSYFLAVGGTSGTGRYQAEFSAALTEHDKGMYIGRYTWAATRQRGFFDFDHQAGTATVRPPGPFTGSGSFVRHGKAKRPGRWSGDLTVSLLGHEPLRLTGSAYRTTLNRKPPYVG